MDLTTPHLFRWDDVPLENVTPTLRRRVITGERAMVAQIWLDKGCIVPRHSHDAEQLSWVFSGALEFTIGGRKIVVRAGQILHIPSNLPHSATALEDTFETDVFSPIRYDWLDGSDTYFHRPPGPSERGADEKPRGKSDVTLRRWRDTPIEQQTSHIVRAYLSGERATVAQVGLRPGAIVPFHSHENEQLTWVQRGVLEIELGGKTYAVRPGSVLRIPGGIEHRATAVDHVQVLDVFSPRRDDWIQKTDHYFRQGNLERR